MKCLNRIALTVTFFSVFFVTSVRADEATRYVTLSPVIAEWVSEILGQNEIEKKLVGVSEYSQYPKFLEKIKTIGPYPQIQVEAVLKLKPTLVLASSEYNRADQIEALKKLKLKVEVLPKETFSEMEAWILKLGQAISEPEKAKLAAKKWKQGIQYLETKLSMNTPRLKRVMIQVQDSPLIVVGGDSFLNEAFEKIGFQNIFKDMKQAYPKVSRESVLKENPEAIFILDLMVHEDEFAKTKVKWENYKKLKAVEDQQIKTIPGDDFARCSLRLLRGLQKLI